MISIPLICESEVDVKLDALQSAHPERAEAVVAKALAEYADVSERTARRWRALIESGAELPEGLLDPKRPCVECGGPLPARRRISRVYCSGKCRVRAFRKAKKP
jgi:ferredoxin